MSFSHVKSCDPLKILVTIPCLLNIIFYHVNACCRVLSQKKWGYAPEAQELDHVDVEGIKWRKGYGEDEDSIEVLESKGLKASDKK